jgi:BirA family transcriptional regulator, biotin operon repressor / biotin---[acetyl-CoA-carboxylase] ligase
MTRPFDVNQFKNLLRTTWVGSEFIYIDTVDSTNSFLKTVPSAEFRHGTIVFADHQKRGRGQYEKSWESAPYRNLTFTFGYRPPSGDRLSLLTLATAMAISNVLQGYTNEKILIKWPNDLIAGDRKIGGILTECVFNGSKPDRVIIGAGINVFQNDFSRNISMKAASLCEISKMNLSREILLSQILAEAEQIYHRWHKFDIDLKREISQKLIGYGQWVNITIYDKPQDQKFKFIGISDKGELLMLNEQLDVNKFSYEQIRILPGGKNISKRNKNIPA